MGKTVYNRCMREKQIWRFFSMKSILERQKQESAKDYVLRVLIHNIVNTELVPGERLIDQKYAVSLA